MSSLRDRLRGYLRHDTHPAVQFIKYGMAGGLATAVHVTLMFLFSWKIFPALTSKDPIVEITGIVPTPVEEGLRDTHYAINSVFAFLVSNLVAYIANVLWVFRPGRHSRRKELALFYIVSGISFVIGTGLATWLIHSLGVETSYAFVVNLIVSLMINYAGRKFFIFKG